MIVDYTQLMATRFGFNPISYSCFGIEPKMIN